VMCYCYYSCLWCYCIRLCWYSYVRSSHCIWAFMMIFSWSFWYVIVCIRVDILCKVDIYRFVGEMLLFVLMFLAAWQALYR